MTFFKPVKDLLENQRFMFTFISTHGNQFLLELQKFDTYLNRNCVA